MAAEEIAAGATAPKPSPPPPEAPPLMSSYLGLSFALFLGLLPRNSAAYVASLQSRNRILAMKLFEAEDQLRQLRSRRKEDAKANARVAEIFAGHRNRWQHEEKRLLHRIDAAEEEIAALKAQVAEMERVEAELRANVERLEKEVAERDEILDSMARRAGGDGCLSESKEAAAGEDDVGKKADGYFSRARVPERLQECYSERNGQLEEMAALFAHQKSFGRDLSIPPADSNPWTDISKGWQDLQYGSLQSMYSMKHFVARRESPWKVDGESSGVSSKLKLLEQELSNMEKGQGNLSKIPSLMKKQAKRYQSLAGKIDDLCRRMQASDPSDPTLSPEFRTHRQTEFLLEAFSLQHRATETRQNLSSLQAEAAKSDLGDELTAQAKLSTRRALDSIRNNFKEIQRNLEVWLARIMGDLEGILAREGASRIRDYYLSPYPFVG